GGSGTFPLLLFHSKLPQSNSCPPVWPGERLCRFAAEGGRQRPECESSWHSRSSSDSLPPEQEPAHGCRLSVGERGRNCQLDLCTGIEFAPDFPLYPSS